MASVGRRGGRGRCDGGGACFEIRVDGKTRSHRDRKGTAIEAGRYLKQMQAPSEITVRDVRDNSVTVIEEGKIVALDLVALSKVFKCLSGEFLNRMNRL
jgi:hypothetical protein